MGGKQRKKQFGNTGEAPTHEEYGNKKGLTGKKRKNKKEKQISGICWAPKP